MCFFLQFVLPSGTIVYVDLADNMLDVSIMPSTLAWGHTSGKFKHHSIDSLNHLSRIQKIYSRQPLKISSQKYEKSQQMKRLKRSYMVMEGHEI